MRTRKFTRRAENSGWLVVRLAATRQEIALCEYTKVELTRESAGIVYFKIVDGNSGFVGQEALLHKKNADLYLSDVGPRAPATVNVRYTGDPAWEVSPFKGRLLQQWAIETFNGTNAQVTLNSVWGGRFTPIPVGVHKIFAPDRSHQNIPTTGYVAVTPGMHGNDVWFPIGLHGGAVPSGRYLHVGHLSEGCITSYELQKWNALYDYLISSREPGYMGKYIGKVTVQK